ncbi:MAG: hypothetical protein JXL84_19690 [Deltaproteobacteria bacterium]|nr:hypothetical protein [Deltaproteobacteria bacterium]
MSPRIAVVGAKDVGVEGSAFWREQGKGVARAATSMEKQVHGSRFKE